MCRNTNLGFRRGCRYETCKYFQANAWYSINSDLHFIHWPKLLLTAEYHSRHHPSTIHYIVVFSFYVMSEKIDHLVSQIKPLQRPINHSTPNLHNTNTICQDNFIEHQAYEIKHCTGPKEDRKCVLTEFSEFF